MAVVVGWEGENTVEMRKGSRGEGRRAVERRIKFTGDFGELWSSWSQQPPKKMSFIFSQVFS